MAGKFSHIICLMGPTATGKTDLALLLAQYLPCEIVSVDSTMVYRGMDIGTAKPNREIRQQVPHHLIDICDPSENYSAGQFCQDAVHAIQEIQQRQRIPLLVGGTMLYFHALQNGLAALPSANETWRAQLNAEAQQLGWPQLHARLQQIDPVSAARIHVNDAQRIQRALEVYALTGKSITEWHAETRKYLDDITIINIILAPRDRSLLQERITRRFQMMLVQGFIEEVRALYTRGNLHPDLPALRAVGYRQMWQYLEDQIDYDTMVKQAVIATQQLAKRQMTWLRSWQQAVWVDCFSPTLLTDVLSRLPT